MKNALLVLGGAAAGGLLGYWAFFWILDQGFYGLILPGGLLGLGAGLARNRSLFLAILCGLVATGLGLLAEWRHAPFIKDNGLGYFLLHVHQLTPLTLIMVALGGFLGFWIPFRRIEYRQQPGSAPRSAAEESTQESAKP